MLGCFALFACQACRVEPEVETVSLVLRELSGCALGRPTAIELQALGDFPAFKRTLAPELAQGAFDGLPHETRELLVRSSLNEGIAVGRRLVTAPASTPDLPLLMLPAGSSCPLGDPAAKASEGAMVAALPSGGLLMAGGRDADGVVGSDAVTFAPGAALVELVPNGMLLGRAYASATPVGRFVVIAGGADDLSRSAHKTYEVFDTETSSFEGSRSGKLSTGSRMEHAALLLPDGRVLLVGGRAEPSGPPLATAELFDLSSGLHEPVIGDAGLADARVLPSLLQLDSGTVLVLGGRVADELSADGVHRRGKLLGSVERFDAALRRFTSLQVTLPLFDEAVSAALPGARVAWLGCDTQPSGRCALSLLLEREGELLREDVALASDDEALGLSELRMIALDSGRLLLTGSAVSDPTARRRAFLVDVNRSTIERLKNVTRVPSALLLLRNGQVAELDASGASLREQDSRSEYESPVGNLIDAELALLALDVATHWERRDGGLQAVTDQARVDIPKLRFGALRMELDCAGDARVLFIDERGETLAVDLVADEIAVPGCRQRLPSGSHLVAVRDQSRLMLRASAGGLLCETTLVGSVRLAVQASARTLLRELRVERR
jgi:hypothetical protein